MPRSTDRTEAVPPRWTHEQIRAARLAPLVPLLERRGLHLVETGAGNFLVQEFAGLIVKDGYWRWPETAKGDGHIGHGATVVCFR